jgi:hypothetical protein
MVEIMSREASSCDLKELVAKFIPEAIGKDIEKACQGIYPLQVRIFCPRGIFLRMDCESRRELWLELRLHCFECGGMLGLHLVM